MIHQSAKNLILYGIGTICNEMMNTWQITNPELFDSILCFVDSRPESWGGLFFDKPVISPDDIRHQDYLKIIITTEKYSDEIFHSLVEQYHVPAEKIIAYPSAGPYEPLLLPNYKLYMENNNLISEYCTRNWLMDKSFGVQIINKGFILPFYEINHVPYGGVYNENKAFVDGHIRTPFPRPPFFDFLHPCQVPSEAICVKETVVYGGIICEHFGHMVTESLTRLWWHIENPNSGYRFAFLIQQISSEFFDFLHILGLTEDSILLIDKPMQFDTIIIPEQTCVLQYGGYRQQALSVYNTIRDSVVPASHEKIYLTRCKLPTNSQLINEDYFEKHFRSLGYEVIAMEQLTIKEQVAIMAGAKYVACTNGTLSHHILFGHDGVNITLLCRSSNPLPAQYWINQVRKANCTMIDVSMNFLTNTHVAPSYLLFPTIYWRRYLQDENIAIKTYPSLLSDFAQGMAEYIRQWSLRMIDYSFLIAIWFPKVPQNILLTDMILRLYWENGEDDESYAVLKHRLYLRMGVVFWDSPDNNKPF